MPAMGFEMTSMAYAPERKTNTMRRLHQTNDSKRSMFNRVAYDFTFDLYIATRKIDDSFRIIEQIVPYFTPEFNIKIEDMRDYGIETNIPFVLNSTDFDIVADGGFDDRRTVLWTLGFTAKAYLYNDTVNTTLINHAIIDIYNIENHEFFEGYRAKVDPLDADETEPHDIIETVVGYEKNTYNMIAEDGSDITTDLEIS